jgi:hypothetical protein
MFDNANSASEIIKRTDEYVEGQFAHVPLLRNKEKEVTF